MQMTWRIGVDIGGTFTDAVAVSGHEIRVAKVASNPDRPGEAVLEALETLALTEIPERFLHGTTLVTNMLLEHKGARTGFITNDGMRDILHIGRHERPLTYAIRQQIPQQHFPPVPREWRCTVPERLAADGQEVTALDAAAVRRAARQLAAEGVEAIAIGFLHSYRFPAHEEQAARIVHDEAPGLFVCTSNEVSPRFREYERFLTTAWNARVAPVAGRYLAALAGGIDQRWPGVALTMMTSNGGLEEVDLRAEIEVRGELRRTPIRLALSGPAAAGNAVVRVAQELGLNHCVGLDVGGTSSDIVVIRDGRLHEAPMEERRLGGYPLQIPMLDLHTIGAGGGSLVHRDAFGALHVGPESAGASPGPACYGLGGERATVTDAAVVTGRLPGSVRLGGTMPLHPDRAHQAVAEAFSAGAAEVYRSALDVLALAEANIAFAVRERTVARGLDPAELALVVAGGAGPLLACGVADALELAEVVIPPRPGLLAAWGLLAAPDRREATVTVLRLLAELSPEEARALFEKGYQKLSKSPPPGAALRRAASLRYLGQGFEVEVPVEDPEDLRTLKQLFHDAHRREYGFAQPDAPVEWIELQVAWEIGAEAWQFPEPARRTDLERPTADLERHQIWERPVIGRELVDWQPVKAPAKLVDRASLEAGTSVTGPMIILEADATTYVPSGWQGRVSAQGYLRLNKALPRQ